MEVKSFKKAFLNEQSTFHISELGEWEEKMFFVGKNSSSRRAVVLGAPIAEVWFGMGGDGYRDDPFRTDIHFTAEILTLEHESFHLFGKKQLYVTEVNRS